MLIHSLVRSNDSLEPEAKPHVDLTRDSHEIAGLLLRDLPEIAEPLTRSPPQVAEPLTQTAPWMGNLNKIILLVSMPNSDQEGFYLSDYLTVGSIPLNMNFSELQSDIIEGSSGSLKMGNPFTLQ